MPTLSVAELVEAARDYVRRSVNLELDLSVESLAFVDHYLSKVGEVSDDLLALLAPAIGTYFGEVVVARLGGSWQVAGEASDWRLALDAAPIIFCPAAVAAEAIRQRDLDGVDAKLHMPAEIEAVIEDALAAAGPVEAAYYYSLTGRLETLEHIVEIIAELRSRGPAPG